MNKETINPFEYTYSEDQMVEIPGQVLHSLLMWLKQVEDDQTMVAYTYAYNTSPKEVKDTDGTVLNVNFEHEAYPSMSSFMNQKPQKVLGALGLVAFDFWNTLGTIHVQNIDKGLTQKIGTVQTPKDVKLS